MATIKTCDIPGCTLPARTVTVAIDTTSTSGSPVGTSRATDVCEAEREAATARLFVECSDAIATIIIS